MNKLLLVLLSLCLFACENNPEEYEPMLKRGIALANVNASAETQAVESAGDAADDAAIWVNVQAPEKSVVLGTNKQVGLKVYNLQAELVASLDIGRLNNVDVRQGLQVAGGTYDIAAASNRSNNAIEIFLINELGDVSHIGTQGLELPEPYGTCMYKDAEGEAWVFVNDKDGRYQQWKLESIEPLSMRLAREFVVATQPEGCAADDSKHILYVGEEEAGLWQLSANADEKAELVSIDVVGADVLVADVEGVDIYRVDENNAWLVVSSQGDNTYAIYDIENQHQYTGSFRVVANESKTIDGTQETDGIAISSANLGGVYAEGLMVIQDGFNRYPKDAQNFKYVAWQDIVKVVEFEGEDK